MAQAFRTVWLEPEEQQIPLVPTPQRRRRLTPSRGSIARIICVVGLVTAVVMLVGYYIHSHARIAQYEFERQAMSTRLRQLQAESAQLKLDIAVLDNANQLTQVAQQESMVFPTADRVQYVQIASALPSAQQAALPAPARSWVAQAGHLLVARLDNIMQRFAHGPGAPAYAQE